MPAGTFFHRAGWATGDRDAPSAMPLISRFAERDGADHRRAAARAGEDDAVRQHADLQCRSASMAVRWRPMPKARPRWISACGERCWCGPGARAVEFRHRNREPKQTDWIERPDLYVTFRKADRGGPREQPEGDPAQAAGDGAQGHPERSCFGCSAAMPMGCTGSMPKACAISARRSSRAAISGR